MKVLFKKTAELSFDGVNTKNYFEGQVYEANSVHEARVFNQAVANGTAVPFSPTGESIEVKVASPVENKKAEPKTTKKVKR